MEVQRKDRKKTGWDNILEILTNIAICHTITIYMQHVTSTIQRSNYHDEKMGPRHQRAKRPPGVSIWLQHTGTKHR